MNIATVPVTDGSASSITVDVGPFRFVSAHFPALGTIPPHTHDRTCLGFMLGGSFDLGFRGGPTHECVPGTVFVEPGGDVHCNCMGRRGARVLVLQPDPRSDVLSRAIERGLEAPTHFVDPGLMALARSIGAELAEPDELTPLALEGSALEILVRVGRRRRQRPRGGSERWLSAVEEILRARFAEPLSIPELAAAVGVHPAHLARTFRASHRCSIGRFVRRLRLEWAAEELRATPRSIAAIAIDAGYHDQSHFTRRFRELLGTTPRRWRGGSGRLSERPASELER